VSTEATADSPRPQRLQVRLARKRRVDQLQPARRCEQERNRLSGTPRIHGDLTPEALRERALKLVERSVVRGRDERQCGLGRSCETLGFGGRQRAPRTRPRSGGQRHRALEEPSRRGYTAAAPPPA